MKAPVLLMSLIFLSFCGYSQDVKLGLKAGFGGATVTNSGIPSLTYQASYVAGGVLECPVTNILSFQAEALFSKKGYASRVIFTDQNGASYSSNTVLRSRLYYIEVPLLLKVKTQGDFVQLFANAGIAPALSIGGSSKYRLAGETYISKTEYIKTVDVGFILSAGLEYSISQLPSFLEVRINDGLSYIFHSTNARHFTYMLSTGILF